MPRTTVCSPPITERYRDRFPISSASSFAARIPLLSDGDPSPERVYATVRWAPHPEVRSVWSSYFFAFRPPTRFVSALETALSVSTDLRSEGPHAQQKPVAFIPYFLLADILEAKPCPTEPPNWFYPSSPPRFDPNVIMRRVQADHRPL